MRKLVYSILTGLFLFSCEEVVVIDVPTSQNLVTVEGWVTNQNENQYIRLTRSNNFISSEPVPAISDAIVEVQSRSGSPNQQFTHVENGLYMSNQPFFAPSNSEFRLIIQLPNGVEIRSKWVTMPELVPLNRLFVDSFEENDPDDPSQQFQVYFPRVIALDPEAKTNYYRWRFFRNGIPYVEPESITIQDDRFFDGNLIPNNFRSFGYDTGDEMVVQFQSINKEAFDYLNLLKSQITSLGTSSGTTPAQVNGNLSIENSEENKAVLGYFGAVAVSSDTTIVED